MQGGRGGPVSAAVLPDVVAREGSASMAASPSASTTFGPSEMEGLRVLLSRAEPSGGISTTSAAYWWACKNGATAPDAERRGGRGSGAATGSPESGWRATKTLVEGGPGSSKR